MAVEVRCDLVQELAISGMFGPWALNRRGHNCLSIAQQCEQADVIIAKFWPLVLLCVLEAGGRLLFKINQVMRRATATVVVYQLTVAGHGGSVAGTTVPTVSTVSSIPAGDTDMIWVTNVHRCGGICCSIEYYYTCRWQRGKREKMAIKSKVSYKKPWLFIHNTKEHKIIFICPARITTLPATVLNFIESPVEPLVRYSTTAAT